MEPKTYQSARQHAVFHLVPEPGFLLVTGEDPQSFLQRQTTNDLRLVLPARAVLTVLTSATARILDVLTVFPAPDLVTPALAVLTLSGMAGHSEHFLRSRIFFIDRVEIQNNSLQYCQVDLLGPEANSVLASLSLPIPAAADDWATGTFQGAPIQIFGKGISLRPGYRLVLPSDLRQLFIEALTRQAAQPCDEEIYQVLRVEAGLPEVGAELGENYTPLEVGLTSRISTNKGCYTGQEIIARQMNFDKVTRSLVGLRLDAPAAAGSSLSAEGKPAGELTSAVISPRLGPIGLGVVRRPHHEPGTVLTLQSPSGLVQAVVSALPFISS